MNHLDESSTAVVALLLDDLAPPRLGTLLRAARKQSGATRRDIANRVGTTTGELRKYERGDAPVPASLIAALAECYGEHLTAQLATRAPIQLDEQRLIVGDDELASDDPDDLLQQYVGIVARLRNSQPGEPIGLRADDLVALSVAIGQDTAHIEARIVALLGCTRSEARSLHSEMLRRKLVLPVAGLVAGVAMVAGAGMAQAAPGSHALHAPHVSQAAHTHTAAATGHLAAAHIAAAHIAAGHVVTEVAASPPTTVVVKPQAAPAPVPDPSPTTTPDTTAPDSPMSIPANETVTMIAP